MVVHEHRTALADVFATRDRDNCFNVLVKIGDALVIRRIDQDVAVAQNKRTLFDKIPGQIDNAARPILHCLCRILNPDVVARTVTEKLLHHISTIADDDQRLPDSCIAQAFDDVLQNRFAAHFDHWFRHFGRKLAHPRSAPRCQHDSLVDLRHDCGAQAASL